jgi:hypothetical protein
MLRDMPERFDRLVQGPSGQPHLIALFNFDDVTRDLTVTLPPGRWRAFERWEERYRGVVEGELEFSLVGPHACRLLVLTPDGPDPGVVGTTGHIGSGVLDITDKSFDRDAAALKVTLAAVGARQTRVYVDSAGRRVAAVKGDGQPLPLQASGSAYFVDVDARQPVLLLWEFERNAGG